MKFRQVFCKDALPHDHVPRTEHLFAIFEDGTLRERFSDEDEGVWHEIPGPRNLPPVKRRNPSKL